MKKHIGVKGTILRIIDIIFKLFLIVCVAFPFYWMIITAFKTNQEALIFPPTMWPENWNFSNFAEALKSMPFFNMYKNTIIVAVTVTAAQFLFVVPAAYGFAKYRFKGSGFFFGIVLLSFMLPQQLTFLPIYLMFSKAKLLEVTLINTLLPQILPFIANGFGIFLLRQYFLQVPEEIIEAARLDNASETRIVLKIMVPMAKSAISAVAMLQFISVWNSYFWPLAMTNSDAVRPISIGVAMLNTTEGGTNWPVLMAACLMMILPIVVAYIFFNKKIQSAFVYKGIK
ncbi:MAG: carbohydrate ABC transporter permease [Eubacteriales bacterium]|nr:carbohydrate ABC transporter permease [Eubacteriales bacterium]